MKISVQNLGALTQAEFELRDLTLICGDNNTGKTYATYALFGFLWYWRTLVSVEIPTSTIDSLFRDGVTRLDVHSYATQIHRALLDGCRKFVDLLPGIFASQSDHFDHAIFQVELDYCIPTATIDSKFDRRIGSAGNTLLSLSKAPGESDLVVSLLANRRESWPAELVRNVISYWIIELLLDGSFPRPFIASAERTGAAMFRSELDDARSRLRGEVPPSEKRDFKLELLSDERSNYPLPVIVNIDFVRRLEATAKGVSFIARKHKDLLVEFSDIVGGDYEVTDNGTIHFIPTVGRHALTMEESSSAVRSLLIIGFYLRHVARPGDLLIVDEPELNLHPRNQRRMARLFARLVKIGIRVFATTHSDYIVKELNTLITLNRDKPHLKRISKKHGYRPEELLRPDQVQVYIAEPSTMVGDERGAPTHTLSRASIDPDLGIEVRSFDETINEMNEIQDAILWGDDG